MAELTINTEDIASAIRKNLEGFEPEVASGQVGRVAVSYTHLTLPTTPYV